VHDINQGGGFGGGGDPSGLLSAGDQPRSNNPLNDVANFGGANSLPGGGKVSANSTSTGSPFQPTFADPAAAAALMAGLSNYHYSVPAGGYLHNDYPSGPLGGGHNEYYIGESHMTGSDPNANKAVGDIYGQLGALPMVQGQSGALAKLQPGGGGAAPSMNDRLASAGVQGPWGGPWEFPGWHLDDTHHGRY
jgi:hypothetical protein